MPFFIIPYILCVLLLLLFTTVLILTGSITKTAKLQEQRPSQKSLNPSFSHSTLSYLATHYLIHILPCVTIFLLDWGVPVRFSSFLKLSWFTSSIWCWSWASRSHIISKFHAHWGDSTLGLSIFWTEAFSIVFFLGWGNFFYFFPYYIQHCFICRHSDSNVPTDAGIEARTVATGALAVRRFNPGLDIIRY